MKGQGLAVTFWGVRGSHPVCGPQFGRFGGNTPCVEITACGERFIIDAGTGLIALGRTLPCDSPPAELHLLLSHLHHDHVSGLPFFRPALRPHNVIHLWCGNLGGDTAEAALGALFRPPLFPVTLDMLPAQFVHHGFCAGETITPRGVAVRTCPLNHPSGATGYRFDCDGRSVCYVSDIEHAPDGPCPLLKAFVAGADLVIYDSMFLEEEYCRCVGWGHSTWREGLRLCREGGARAMAMFHLHPERDDAALDSIEAELKAECPASFVAREGMRLTFG